jgi:hypothetical protein
MRWFQRPGLPILVSACIAVIAAWASQLVTHDLGVQLTLGLLAGIAVLQVCGLWQSHARTPLQAKLEEALIDEQLYKNLDRIITSSGRLTARLSQGPDCGFLFEARKAECLAGAANVMDQIAAGRLIVSDPDQSDKLAVDLATLARTSMLAISYRDEDFWGSEAGESYLKQNKRLIDKKGEVQRIFVLGSDQMIQRLKPIIDRHTRLGVKTFLLPPVKQTPADHEDFVVVDDAYVRHAEPVEFAGSRKRATLTVEPVDVTRYVAKFQEMLARCQSAEAYFGTGPGTFTAPKPRGVKANGDRVLSTSVPTLDEVPN